MEIQVLIWMGCEPTTDIRNIRVGGAGHRQDRRFNLKNIEAREKVSRFA
jgi:hypothetical protein